MSSIKRTIKYIKNECHVDIHNQLKSKIGKLFLHGNSCVCGMYDT